MTLGKGWLASNGPARLEPEVRGGKPVLTCPECFETGHLSREVEAAGFEVFCPNVGEWKTALESQRLTFSQRLYLWFLAKSKGKNHPLS